MKLIIIALLLFLLSSMVGAQIFYITCHDSVNGTLVYSYADPHKVVRGTTLYIGVTPNTPTVRWSRMMMSFYIKPWDIKLDPKTTIPWLHCDLGIDNLFWYSYLGWAPFVGWNRIEHHEYVPSTPTVPGYYRTMVRYIFPVHIPDLKMLVGVKLYAQAFEWSQEDPGNYNLPGGFTETKVKTIEIIQPQEQHRSIK